MTTNYQPPKTRLRTETRFVIKGRHENRKKKCSEEAGLYELTCVRKEDKRND
jgi:hypothetical protein